MDETPNGNLYILGEDVWGEFLRGIFHWKFFMGIFTPYTFCVALQGFHNENLPNFGKITFCVF